MFRKFVKPPVLLAPLSALTLPTIVVGTILFMQALQGTRSILATTRVDLVEEQTLKSILQGKNAELESALDYSRARIQELDAVVESVSGELADSQLTNDALNQANFDLTGNLDSNISENARLSDTINHLQAGWALEEERHRETGRLLSVANAENEILTGELAKETGKRNALIQAVGGLEKVENERDRLASAVNALNA